jgi:hypothetical protein
MFLEKKVLVSFVGGYVLGKNSNAIFGSEKAKECYRRAATSAFILKDMVMEKVEVLQAEASDILADARAEADKYQEKKDAEYNFCVKDMPEEVAVADAE